MFVLTGSNTMNYFYLKAIIERVSKPEALAFELLSDSGEHTHLWETSEEKVKKFVQIFVHGMYVLTYALILYI